MSEPKLISPLLDGFSMGDAVSEHDGVRCCPALKENSDEKYIVKIISIPASQVQLDALLLTGAYDEPTAALDYFKELAEKTEKEAAALKNLSRLEGFLAYEGIQVVPMDQTRLGYEVYLLSPYRYSLEKYVRRNNMTHQGAINLGIDICNALSAARRAGWIYMDLKPSNIFISENGEYRIGDLGFLELDGLELSSLPAKYRNPYTAPELQDDLGCPNTTADTYSLGLILYQIFNNGVLPQVAHPTEDVLPAPENADYELAEILLKACAPAPRDRWESPVDMGQALVAYMQRNAVTEEPIIPPVAQLPADTAPLPEVRKDETLPGMNDAHDIDVEDLSPEMSNMIARADSIISYQLPDPPTAPEAATLEDLEANVLREAEEQKRLEEEQALEEQRRQQEKELELQAILDAEKEAEKADAAHLDVKPATPEPARKKAKKKKKAKADKVTNLDSHRKKLRRKGWISPILTVLILGLLGFGGFWFYQNYYVQMVDSLSVTGTENSMTVILDTQVEDGMLTIVCNDTYGNTTRRDVVDGQATFTDLLPDMLYKIRVEIDGFHKLSGSTTHEYMTPAETKIVSFTAVTGPEDGSVILNFTVDGPNSEQWDVVCTTEGEEPIRQTFTGHMITVKGLTLGKTYAIRLVPATDLYIIQGDTLEFTASSIIIAENLRLSTDSDGVLTATWNAPEGSTVDSWDVYCYSGDGYENRLTTTETTVSFPDVNAASSYTVEVTAQGMTQSARAGITANPIYVDNIQVDTSDPMKLGVSWDFTGTAPEGGWLLMYTIDGTEMEQVVQCDTNSGIIDIRVPAASYRITIQSADGRTVFTNTTTFQTPNAEVYANQYQAFFPGSQSGHFFVDMIRTPEKENWTHSDVTNASYTNTFKAGEGAGVLLYYTHNFYLYHEDITVMYVIRDENGKVLPEYISIENLDWHDDMWCGRIYHYCGLTIPKVPKTPGKYSLCLYFDGGAVTIAEFTITE